MRYRSLAISAVGVVIAFAITATSPGRVAADAAQCQQVSIPVTLSSLDPTAYHIAGKLCWQGTLAGKTMQLLVHGYTYDQNYWDFPYQQPAYSYVTAATQAGYATLAIDRIGVGQSDHPLPELVTTISEGYTIHEIVQDLHSGTIGSTAFPKVVLVGHSLGTLIAWQEAATYQDVSGVIASGWLHTLNPTAAASILAATYPADLDPKFANSGLPVGYVTTLPGTRGPLFYNTADADPNVIALDEQMKQTGTDGEELTFPAGEDPLLTLSIHAPVLAAVGQSDSIFCVPLLLSCNTNTAVKNREQAFYNPDTCLEGYALPGSGHDMNLHLNATTWFNAANDWIARRVGATATTDPTQPCAP